MEIQYSVLTAAHGHLFRRHVIDRKAWPEGETENSLRGEIKMIVIFNEAVISSERVLVIMKGTPRKEESVEKIISV